MIEKLELGNGQEWKDYKNTTNATITRITPCPN